MTERRIDQIEIEEYAKAKQAKELVAGLSTNKIEQIDKQRDLKEISEAYVTLGNMEEIDPDKVSEKDERILFEISSKSYAYNKNTYYDGMNLDEAKELLDIENIFFEMMVRERVLDGKSKDDIKKDQKIIDISAEYAKEKAAYKKHEQSENDAKEYSESITVSKETLERELKNLDEERERKYGRFEGLEQKVAAIRGLEEKDKIIDFLVQKLDLEDTRQPEHKSLQLKFGNLSQAKELETSELQNRTIDILIQKEVANRPEEVPMTFGAASDLLGRKLSEEQIKQNLEDADLTNYYRDRFVANRELFEATTNDEKKVLKEELLANYSRRARTRVVERLNEISEEEWQSEIHYGDIKEFLLGDDNVSISEIAAFLDRDQFISMYERVHDRDNINHFDAEGRPIDPTGREIIRRFRETASDIAKENEYLAIEEHVLKEFNEDGPLGAPVNKALVACERAISENKPRSWRERNTLFVLNAKVRERRQGKLEAYRAANDEKRRIEKFKESYLREQGAHTAKLWAFERDVKEKIEGSGGLRDAEMLLSENLDQRTRRQIRKVASRLRMEGIYLNEKVIKRFDQLTDCKELLNAFNEEGYESFNNFAERELIDEAGWEVPSRLGTTEQNGKYGTTLAGEKKSFAQGMDYRPIREEIQVYVRRETVRELRTRVQNDLRLEAIKTGHIVDNESINQRMEALYPEGELNRIIEERIYQNGIELNDRFNREHSGGMLDFAANVGYLGKMIRRDLHGEIYGDRAGKNINVTKVIDLLDMQRVNDLHLHERDRRFQLEIRRFAGKERWRQRWEGLNRRISGNPTFKRDEYKGLIDALEEGTSLRSSMYQTSAKAKAYTLGAFGRLSEFGNLVKRNIVYTPFSWIAPYSEGTRQKIADTLENQQRRYANRRFRWDRIINFGMLADFPRARA